MHIHFLTLFPEMFPGILEASIMKKAQEQGAVEFSVTDFREYTENKHKKVDDYPYGGGAGMVLQPQPLFDAVDAVTKTEKKRRVILMCPQGERFTQAKAEELSQEEELVFICGHYEGYDERIREHLVTDELSLGDFVLTGGELAAMTIADSVVRLLPDAIGKRESHEDDSFSTGLLEYPHYTRPADFRGLRVPDVLLSGNHAKIAEWRQYESLKRTYKRRPDLLETYPLTKRDREMLQQIKKELEEK
ncbi:tRNA (guanosine(37)-N1)-methyltransferase TrmD [Savagea faecisuis]|uniref:tRNA (guanine-N(1)-)-methyltransferase n=1 Tax=Savagea faecisuis TaxID=1274803 RepID=A0ABW3GVS9_9BACL